MTTHNKIKGLENRMTKFKQLNKDKNFLIVDAYYDDDDRFETGGRTYTKKEYEKIAKSSGRKVICIMNYCSPTE